MENIFITVDNYNSNKAEYQKLQNHTVNELSYIIEIDNEININGYVYHSSNTDKLWPSQNLGQNSLKYILYGTR